MSENRYAKSQEMFRRAIKTIPLGSQTFSKSYLSYPEGNAPLFLSHGKGAHVWDVDGNEYIDLVNGLLPVVLGYDDPEVTAAVTEQLRHGVTFSLATELEIILAEELVKLIPCAEMVRFGKNGSDATSGAIRLARAHTGRDRVATCGYHGWQDWYIGSTARNKGVPKRVQELTHTFRYNDLDSLEQVLKAYPNEFAAVIMEPMTSIEPQTGFLEGVRDLAHRHGALFILDEIITGYRFHLGGAQSLFGITPDLATFGKSMGNGFPISAVVGRKDVMKGMEDIFFSFTAGGEAVSIAAALATIKKMQKEPVVETLWSRGEALVSGTKALIQKHELNKVVTVAGKPCWSMLGFNDTAQNSLWEIKTLFLQEILTRGILTAGAHNISYAHTEEDIKKILAAYDASFEILTNAIRSGDLKRRLKGKPMEPVFKVR